MRLYLVLALVVLGTCALVKGQLNGAMGGGAGGAMTNPMTMYLMWQMMGDPKMKHMPLMSMLMQNPALLYNPMGAFVMAKMLGVDLHKIATPMAMANGGAGLMRWMPLIMGDPSKLSLLYSFGLLGGSGAGSGMGPMG